MVNRKGIKPSHILFADDVFLFCNGDRRNVKKLMGILKDYQCASGQMISMEKSKCFIGGTSDIRKNQISEDCGIPLAEFPDKYLGVQLFSGSVKSHHVWNGVEMMQDRLAGWKGKLLSFQERLILVKFVLSSLPIYNMSVYRWPKRVIKECERIIRNFLWTGDLSHRKQVTLKWDKVCSPLSEGGLGIRRLEVVNKALLMNLFWNIQHGTEEMAKIFQAKFQNKEGEWIKYFKKSTIWQGIKGVKIEVHEGTRCLVGNGETISMWKYKWIQDQTLGESFQNHSFIHQYPNMKVADLILEGEWVVPNDMLGMIEISELHVITGGEDRRIWSHTISGVFTVASAVEELREKFPKLQWTSQVWHPSVHPNVSRNMFNFINPRSFDEMLKMAKNRSPAIKEVWRVSSFITMRELWFAINKCIYEEEILSLEIIKKKILKITLECEVRMKAPMWNASDDLQVLKNLGLKCRKVKSMSVKEVFFHLPPANKILLCCDGASKGNPGISGYGFIGRSSTGEYLVAVSGGLGVSTNFYAEILAILKAGEWVVSKKHKEVLFRTDSSAAILAFQSKKIPWFAVKRWEKICANLTSWCFIHSYRDVNFSADGLAKKGNNLARGEEESLRQDLNFKLHWSYQTDPITYFAESKPALAYFIYILFLFVISISVPLRNNFCNNL
ncbi:uncharacterized protein LOC113360042 [Papaver somniferum]|uniref:uncharacterized protein LOC113360042 n=1 Tax=Papaver somniferum TaxID=3469 RepID=UPI000E6F7D5F|nr:uncharacterized protein LOC113360042 [Papaver somniferum]